MNRRQFSVLWRAFFAQFFTSETVTSDVQLHQSIMWVLAFLLAPGLLVLFSLPSYHLATLLAARFHEPRLVDDVIERIAMRFVVYSMVTVGLIAAFTWDSLAFDRRDAMVLGPLPVRGATVVLAKAAALVVFLGAATTSVNLLNAILFAFGTTDRGGVLMLGGRFLALFATTVAAASCVFAFVATLRGLVALAGQPRVASMLGSLVQFLAVAALLIFTVLSPTSASGPPRVRGLPPSPSYETWMPQTWFLGLFEALRGSPRQYLVAVAGRAGAVTAFAIAAAAVVLVAGYRRQMRLALTPAASAGELGRARLGRWLARLVASRDAVARAAVDFVLLTLARSRAHRAPLAINAAIGAALAAAGLASRVQNMASVTTPRTATLWIPLLAAYWIAVGLRAAFFVPAELPAAWLFHAVAPARPQAYWSAVRASAFAVVAPPALCLTALLTAFVGRRVAVWHGVIVLAMSALLAEIAALTVDFIPFTRPYRPGHARLKTRWWLYAFGAFAFAYLPTRWELRALGSRADLVWLAGALAFAVAALDLAGRWRASKWTVQSHDEEDEDAPHISVLALGGAVERA